MDRPYLKIFESPAGHKRRSSCAVLRSKGIQRQDCHCPQLSRPVPPLPHPTCIVLSAMPLQSFSKCPITLCRIWNNFP
eukprot:1099761-Karenia_brevis.AAC.1